MATAKTTDQGYQVCLDNLRVYVTDMRTFRGVVDKQFTEPSEALEYYDTGFEDDLPKPLVFHECTGIKPPFNDGETEMILLLHKGWGEWAVGHFTQYDEDSEPWLVLSGVDAYKVNAEDYLWAYLPNPRLYLEEL